MIGRVQALPLPVRVVLSPIIIPVMIATLIVVGLSVFVMYPFLRPEEINRIIDWLDS